MDIVVEFFEVAIHCILYNRDLYPQGVFEKRKKYNVPVQVSEYRVIRLLYWAQKSEKGRKMRESGEKREK